MTKKIIKFKKKEYLENGIRLKNQRVSKITILTIVGKINLKRTILIPADKTSAENLKLLEGENAKSVIPLDQIFLLNKLPLKMTINMMIKLAKLAISLSSFEETEKVVYNLLKIKVGDDTIRKAVNIIGKIVYNYDKKNSFRILSEEKKHRFNRNGILYVETDGSFVCIVDKKKLKWKEIKAGVTFNSNDLIKYKDKNGNDQYKIGKREYICYLDNADNFRKHLYALLLKSGHSEFEKTILISDGASWIKVFYREYLAGYIHILDFWHLSKNANDFALFIYKNKDIAKEKSDEWCKLLKNSEYEKGLREIYKYREQKTEPDLVNLYTYISNNIEIIDYKKYISEGYFIGSGGIEGANKSVVQERLKLSGMRWNEDMAQYVATLRSKYCSELWDKEVIPIIYNFFQ